MSLYYRKNGVFLPLGDGSGGGGGGEPCPPPEDGQLPFPIVQPSINLVSDSTARTALQIDENWPNWVPYGSLQIAVIMWRALPGQVTYSVGQSEHPFVPYYLDGLGEMGMNQRLNIFTRMKPNSHTWRHTWSGPNARCAGAIANFPSGNRWQITDIRTSYSNGLTNDIETLPDRVNLVASTWIYNASSAVTQDLHGRDSFFVRKTTDVKAQSRLHLGFVSGETVVRSYNNYSTSQDPFNHGSICISLTYT